VIADALELGVHLGAQEDREAGQVEPHQHHSDGGQRAVVDGVLAEPRHVLAERPRHEHPAEHRGEGAGPDDSPDVRRVGHRQPVERAEPGREDHREQADRAELRPRAREHPVGAHDDPVQERRRRAHVAAEQLVDGQHEPDGAADHQQREDHPADREQALLPPGAVGRPRDELEDIHQVVDAVGREDQEPEEAEGRDRLRRGVAHHAQLVGDELGCCPWHQPEERAREGVCAALLDDLPQQEAGEDHQRDEPQEEVERHRRRVIERVVVVQPLAHAASELERPPDRASGRCGGELGGGFLHRVRPGRLVCSTGCAAHVERRPGVGHCVVSSEQPA
jgi:hypothetical protein